MADSDIDVSPPLLPVEPSFLMGEGLIEHAIHRRVEAEAARSKIQMLKTTLADRQLRYDSLVRDQDAAESRLQSLRTAIDQAEADKWRSQAMQERTRRNIELLSTARWRCGGDGRSWRVSERLTQLQAFSGHERADLAADDEIQRECEKIKHLLEQAAERIGGDRCKVRQLALARVFF